MVSFNKWFLKVIWPIPHIRQKELCARAHSQPARATESLRFIMEDAELTKFYQPGRRRHTRVPLPS